jgi:Secretion system C-terminal sorting domain
MKYPISFVLLIIISLFSLNTLAQCIGGTDSVYIQVVTANRGYEVYWQLVPDTNLCGNGTIFTGGNTAQMNCNGANANVATPGNGYANYDTITEGPFCLTTNNKYSIRFIDDSGASENHFFVIIKGQPVYHFLALENELLFTFNVIPPLEYDLGIKKISTTSYVTANPLSISGKIFNYSYTTIQSMDIHYSINNGVVNTDQLTGLNFSPYTEWCFNHATLFAPPANGTYEVKVWVDNLNGYADMNNNNDTLYKVFTTGNPVPNIVDQYLINTPAFLLVADASDQLYRPSDLDFHTILSNNELWVTNRSDIISQGSTVTFYNAGTPSQVALYRQDAGADHFMILPSALAFSDNTNFATSAAILDAHMGSGRFAGPALWSSDSLVYCQPGPGPLGSHLDMLHQSPFSMGIAAEHENAFWVYDGYNQAITWYDFQQDHGPGYDDHTDGLIRRYTDITLNRINDSIPNHLVLDDAGILYVVDNGNARVIKMDTHTGSVTGSFTPYQEYVTEHSIVTGTTWNNFISTGLIQPCGIDVIGDRLIVSDFFNGDIIIYNTTNATGTELGRIQTGSPGIAGVKIGPDGRIWYVNQLEHKVYKIDIAVDVNNVNAENDFVSVYPNPATELLYIRSDNKSENNLRLQITNSIGQLVFSELMSNNTSIKIADFKAGVYVVSISGNDFIKTTKLVINR